jgi:porphyrinogen peroxidase
MGASSGGWIKMKTHPLYQLGIFAPVPKQARYLFFSEIAKANLLPAIHYLQTHVDGVSSVLGLGHALAEKLGSSIPGLKTFVAPVGSKVEIPDLPFSLFIWLREGDQGELLHRTRELEKGLAGAFVLSDSANSFMFKEGRDLTGYVDGTENPKGKKAISTGFVSGSGPGLDGSSFVAVQRWIHDMNIFEGMGKKAQDHSIGRRRKDNVEIANAPESAHVKRTAQENFTPEAFVLRRSMPWSDGKDAGLIFTAFGHSFDAFEAQLLRMSGAEDGVTDALFSFTRPLSTAYFWCPPMRAGKLDLRVLKKGKSF